MMTREYLIEELTEAYFDCRRNKRNKRSALEFEMQWLQNVCMLADELYDRTYEIGESITFIVTRPKWREVFAASFRDRVVHHYIIRRLEPLFEQTFIDDTYNCRKGKGTLYGAHRVHEMIRECSEDYTRDCYVAKFDMQGFFMSIHKPTLWGMLEDFIMRNYFGEDKDLLLWLTKKVVTHCPTKRCRRQSRSWMWAQIPPDKSLFTTGDDYGLPIGNITSQMFANFYLTGFDRVMSGMFDHYGRYVDDFVVVDRDKQKILRAISAMRDYLARLHVRLHPDKFYLQYYTKGVQFVGIVSKMRRTYAGNRTVHNFERTMIECNDIADKEAYAECFVARVNSYIGYMIHHKSYAIRRRVLSLRSTDWNKYVYVRGRHRALVLRPRYRVRNKQKQVLYEFSNKQMCAG